MKIGDGSFLAFKFIGQSWFCQVVMACYWCAIEMLYTSLVV